MVVAVINKERNFKDFRGFMAQYPNFSSHICEHVIELFCFLTDFIYLGNSGSSESSECFFNHVIIYCKQEHRVRHRRSTDREKKKLAKQKTLTGRPRRRRRCRRRRRRRPRKGHGNSCRFFFKSRANN